jgi:hypothetical protein
MTSDSETMPDEISAGFRFGKLTCCPDDPLNELIDSTRYARLPDGLTLEGLCRAVDDISRYAYSKEVGNGSEEFIKHYPTITAARAWLEKKNVS